MKFIYLKDARSAAGAADAELDTEERGGGVVKG